MTAAIHFPAFHLTETGLALLAMTYLVLKHFFADFVLQTPYQFRNKGRYGHPGGILHAGLHGLLSFPVFLILSPASMAEASVVIALEIVVHYHTDYGKEQLVRRAQLTHVEAEYWWLFGADQLIHNLTYLAIVMYLSGVVTMAV